MIADKIGLSIIKRYNVKNNKNVIITSEDPQVEIIIFKGFMNHKDNANHYCFGFYLLFHK